MTAYYNEIDPKAAAWLRELIKAELIAPGEVDERSIVDIRPSELTGFVQCHFFAGIGVWPYALRRAGWPDHRPVWTGSCPCQPFSAAGKGGGFDDERHLWPAFFHLIGECGTPVVFGEQVASKGADIWIDLVQTDMEALGYAFGAVPFPSAGIGAPHIRDRTYWMADALRNGACDRPRCGLDEEATPHGIDGRLSGQRLRPGFEGESGGLGNPDGSGWQSGELAEDKPTGRSKSSGTSGWVDDATGTRHERSLGIAESTPRDEARLRLPDAGREIGRMANAFGDGWRASGYGHNGRHDGAQLDADGSYDWPGPTNGFWRDADWLHCRDERWRPVEPGTFPLAHGAPARVGRLRGYGNAINAEAAIAFIQAATDHEIIDMRAA